MASLTSCSTAQPEETATAPVALQPSSESFLNGKPLSPGPAILAMIGGAGFLWVCIIGLVIR